MTWSRPQAAHACEPPRRRSTRPSFRAYSRPSSPRSVANSLLTSMRSAVRIRNADVARFTSHAMRSSKRSILLPARGYRARPSRRAARDESLDAAQALDIGDDPFAELADFQALIAMPMGDTSWSRTKLAAVR